MLTKQSNRTDPVIGFPQASQKKSTSAVSESGPEINSESEFDSTLDFEAELDIGFGEESGLELELESDSDSGSDSDSDCESDPELVSDSDFIFVTFNGRSSPRLQKCLRQCTRVQRRTRQQEQLSHFGILFAHLVFCRNCGFLFVIFKRGHAKASCVVSFRNQPSCYRYRSSCETSENSHATGYRYLYRV